MDSVARDILRVGATGLAVTGGMSVVALLWLARLRRKRGIGQPEPTPSRLQLFQLLLAVLLVSPAVGLFFGFAGMLVAFVAMLLMEQGHVGDRQGLVAFKFGLLSIVAGPLAVCAFENLRRKRRERIWATGLCHSCGYDLRGSPAGGACPECGAPRPAVVVGRKA